MTFSTADGKFTSRCSIDRLARRFVRRGVAAVAQFCHLDTGNTGFAGEVEDDMVEPNDKPTLAGWISAALPRRANRFGPPANTVEAEIETARRGFHRVQRRG